MIGVDRLIEKLNSLISGGSLTELEVTQLSKVVDTLEKKGVSSVLSTIYLPNVVENKGRLFWLQTEQRYVYSNGVVWEVENLFKYYVNLYTWGFNNSGRLGTGDTTSTSSPVSILTRAVNWTAVSCGDAHTLALRANGTLWAWGRNDEGRLGDNTITSRISPVSVVGGFTDWVSINAAENHSLGLRANGTIWAWGLNTYGRLGDNTVTSRLSPVSVVGGFTDWVYANSGPAARQSVAIRGNGVLYAWGRNQFGELGDGTASSRSSPVIVTGGFTDWILASTNLEHTLGLRANGTAWAWGRGTYGRLGDNNTLDRNSPVAVAGGFTDWISLSAGYRNSVGLRANGTVWTWGRNQFGELGDTTTVSKNSPVDVVGGITDWTSISMGKFHTLATRANGTLWGWGRNGGGYIGDGSTSNRSSPVAVLGGFTDWVSVSSGSSHSGGIRTA
jgi:alpha-tubulin suppressor-like RCC1 family protein